MAKKTPPRYAPTSYMDPKWVQKKPTSTTLGRKNQIPSGYYKDWFQNQIDLHKVQGVTPVQHTENPWVGQYEPLPQIRRQRPAPGTAQPYSPAMPTAAGDFISEWRATEYQRQFDPGRPGQFRQGNDSVGPGGEPLPQGAMGWNDKGRAYYGEGFSGLISEWKNKIAVDITSEDVAAKVARWKESAIPDALKAYEEEIALAETPEEIQAAFENYQKNKGALPEQVGEGLSAIGTGYDVALEWAKQSGLVRGVNETVRLALGAFGEVAKVTKRGLSAEGTGLAKAGEGSNLPPTPQVKIGGWDFTPLVNSMFTPFLLYNLYRGATGPKPTDEKISDIEQAHQAGRILYSSVVNPMLGEEFNRRYIAGENPYLLASELEMPIVEAIGESIFDPLNVVFSLGKTAKAAKLLGKIDDFTDIAPDIVKGIDAASKAVNEAEALQHIPGIVDKVIEARKLRLNWFQRLATARGGSSLISSGKDFVTSQRVGEFIKVIVAHAGSSDDAIDMVRAMHLLASDVPSEVAKGMMIIRNFPEAKMFLTNGGMDASIVMRAIMGEDPTKLLKALEKAKKDKTGIEAIQAVADLAVERMDAATHTLFPTLTEKIAAAKKLAGTGEAGAKALEAGAAQVRALKAAGKGKVVEEIEGATKLGFAAIEKLPWNTRALVKFDIAAQKVYQPVNAFFAGVYMGLSPAYASRNLSNNVFTAWIDEGLGAAFGNMSKRKSETAEYLAGMLPEAMGRGVSTLKGTNVGAASKMPGIWLGNKAEEWTAVNVTATAVRRAMRQMLKPGAAIPSIEPLLKVGMPPAQATALWKLMVKNKGNVSKTIEEFTKMAKSGAIDVLKTGGWIDEKLAAKLDEGGLLDEVREIAARDGLTLEEKRAAIAKRITDEIAKGDRVWGEPAAIPTTYIDDITGETRPTEALPIIETLGEAHSKGDIAADLIEPVTNFYKANQNSWRAFRRVLKQVLDEGDVSGAFVTPEGQKIRRELFDILSGENKQIDEVVAFCEERKNTAVSFRDWSMDVGTKEKPDWWSLDEAWRRLGVEGDAPKNWFEFRNRMWQDYFQRPTRAKWNEYRDFMVKYVEDKVAQFPPSDTRLLEQARQQDNTAKAWEMVIGDREVDAAISTARLNKDYGLYARTRALQYGIPSASKTGVPLDKTLLIIINKNLPEGVVPFEKLSDVPFEVSDSALVSWFNKRAGTMPLPPEELKAVQQSAEQLPLTLSREEQAANLARTNAQYGIGEVTPPVVAPKVPRPPVPPYAEGQTPTDARIIAESIKGLQDAGKQLDRALVDNYGKFTNATWTPEIQKAMTEWAAEAERRMPQARLLAMKEGDAARKFALHNYGEKYGFDLALSYIFPYHFWYSRTYMNWLKRIASNPAFVANYARYKETLAKEHAGAPEWWKYNINSNEVIGTAAQLTGYKDLLGLQSDHPLFFNLEQSLNPLQALSGVDFNDQRKRLNWWTTVIDDMGKFGPSIYTPYQWAVAAVLASQGEDEAASRWAGRLFPQTTNIKNIFSSVGLNFHPFGQGTNEYDPFIQLFSGGIDPYERARTGRALGSLIDTGQVDPATALDAANFQNNQTWSDANELAVRQRAGNPFMAVTNLLLGTGFKARNITDMQIDRMDQEWRFLWGRRDTMAPEAFQTAMDALKEKYPFLETVILSRKSGDERDEAYAYNVLSRIPPGQKDDAAAMVGLNPNLIGVFYDTKGAALATWKQPERDKFMASIVELGAILDLPDTATRQEWNMAKDLYQSMNTTIQQQWGEDMLDKFTTFYAYKDDYVGRDEYLKINPDVQDALEYKDYIANNDPLLRQYYGSFDKVAKYYDSLMYDDVKRILGEDIFELQDQLRTLQLLDEEAAADFKTAHPELDTASKISKYKKANPDWGDDKQAERFKEEHPQLGQYYDLTHSYKTRIAEVLTSLASKVKEPTYVFRPDTTPETSGEINLVRTLNEPATPEIYRMSAADFENLMSPTLWRLTLDAVIGGEDLSRAASDQLDFIAGDLGISQELLLELIGQSVR